MANWACTTYVIEGPKDTLQRISDAIKNPITVEKSSKGWEGNVLNTFGIDFNCEINGRPAYLRGFIDADAEWEKDHLKFYAEEAWGTTDFKEVLEKYFPDIKVYFVTTEESCGVFETNDKEGKYFPDRYYIDVCINGDYDIEYFAHEDEMYKYIKKLTDGKVCNVDDVNKFNEKHEEDGDEDENFILIHTCRIVD